MNTGMNYIAVHILVLSLAVCPQASGQGGIITTVAGNGTQGFSGDGGPAISASLNPYAVAVDTSGDLFVADFVNNRIRKVSASGIITTVAGTGTAGFSGDGGLATSAELSLPQGIAVDSLGSFYIADFNGRIREVSSSGIITTVAGGGQPMPLKTGLAATSVDLTYATGVTVDGSGNVYIAESDSNISLVFRMSAAGIITAVVGNGTNGFSGDGGPAASAEINFPQGMAVDAAGNLFIADTHNNRIRKVSPGGTITTVAGSANFGFSGDGGLATSAELNGPTGVAVDSSGNLFIADTANNRIRKVSAGGIITTIAGNGTFGFSGDGGPASSAELGGPTGVAVDGHGNLFIAEYVNNRIRKVSATVPAPSIDLGGIVPVDSPVNTIQPANGCRSTAPTSPVRP
jgi:trimeric autotransporter adhesin